MTELRWVGLGPELALGLFAVFAVYTAALPATTFRRPIPGLGWLSGHRDVTVGLNLLALVPASALSPVLASATTISAKIARPRCRTNRRLPAVLGSGAISN